MLKDPQFDLNRQHNLLTQILDFLPSAMTAGGANTVRPRRFELGQALACRLPELSRTDRLRVQSSLQMGLTAASSGLSDGIRPQEDELAMKELCAFHDCVERFTKVLHQHGFVSKDKAEKVRTNLLNGVPPKPVASLAPQ